MCGISGIYNYKYSNININYFITQSSSKMVSRGPDGESSWKHDSNRLAFAHRRLAIIDTHIRSTQPMRDPKSGNILIFNGEIYNFKELRHELQLQGEVFLTKSDTEVILKLYNIYGVLAFSKLRGMYAIAIWDEEKKKITLARDPLGIKPLYIFNNGNTFAFSSQVKSLLAGIQSTPTIQNAGLVGFHIWGHIPEPFTLYENITALPPGSYQEIDWQGRTCSNYFESVDSAISENQNNSIGDIFLNIEDSIRYHLVSDVPIALFLSSGLDSTLLAYYADKLNKVNKNTNPPLTCLTLGFQEQSNTAADETILASKYAKEMHFNHKIKIISYDDFLNHHDLLLHSMDQPSIDGINTFFISQFAKEQNFKVVLSGLGGDELFWGYKNFKSIPFQQKIMKYNPLKRLKPTYFPKRFRTKFPKHLSLFSFSDNLEQSYLLNRCLHLPWELYDLLPQAIVNDGLEKLGTINQLSNSNPKTQLLEFNLSSLEVKHYMRNQLLRDSDWASMAHSVELRVPFVDLPLLKFIRSMQLHGILVNKSILKKYSKGNLPSYILDKKKTGFTTPIGKWINKKLDVHENTSTNHPSKNWAYHLIDYFL